MLLLCASSSSLLAASLLWLFLGHVFRALRMFRVFLSCSCGLPISRSPPCLGLELFLGFLSFRLLGFPVLSSPCGVSRFAALSLFLSIQEIILDWMVSASVLFGGVPPSPSVHRPSLGWPTRSISLLRLSFWSVLGGRCSPCFPPFSPFGHLSASPFVLSPCPLDFSLLLVVCSCLLSPIGQGSPRLGVPLCSGWIFPRLSLFCVFGLYQFGSFPTFLSGSSSVLRPGGCSFP